MYCKAPLSCCSSTYFVGMLSVGGLPAPVYFGALIDSTCLKWSIKKCGGRGACRIYDSAMYRYAMDCKCGNRTSLLCHCYSSYSTASAELTSVGCYFRRYNKKDSFDCLYFQDHLPGSDHLSQWFLVFLHHCCHHPPQKTISETRARNGDAAQKTFKGNWTSGPIQSHWEEALRS